MISRVARYCGPAAIASALGISRQEAAERLLQHQPRSRGRFKWESIAGVLGITLSPQLPARIKRCKPHARPTLAQWLKTDGRDSILFVSSHFVHVRGGKVVEDNSWPCRRGRVKVVILTEPPRQETDHGEA